MGKKIILSLVILLSFFVVVILPANWNVCIPDGCTFSNNACANNSCLDDTLGQHFNERTSLFSPIVKLQPSIFLAVILLSFFISQRYLLGALRFSADKLYVKYRLFNFSRRKIFDYLLEAFSSGILHPQIYFPVN